MWERKAREIEKGKEKRRGFIVLSQIFRSQKPKLNMKAINEANLIQTLKRDRAHRSQKKPTAKLHANKSPTKRKITTTQNYKRESLPVASFFGIFPFVALTEKARNIFYTFFLVKTCSSIAGTPEAEVENFSLRLR